MKNIVLPILVVEDDPSLREALVDTLELARYRVITAVDGSDALQKLAQETVGLVVSDVQMKPMDGHTLLIEIKQRYPHIPVILMTAYGVIDKAIQAIKAGACNYLTKPFEPNALLDEVTRTMLPSWPPHDAASASDVIAEDSASRAIFELADRVAETDATVLITGESGTGKEVMARYIHSHSPRHNQPFIAINCAAIPDTLLESLLFGYEKGSFSGAVKSQAGKFEQANGGTLLLDEVTEMPLSLQAKMLRVIQEREVERLGGNHPIKLDLRLIATSNRDMEAAVHENQFREDLFYRLSVFPIELPALRKRAADIIPLAQHVLNRLTEGNGKNARFSSAAANALQNHSWPGNIRELENVVQRALILSNGNTIEPSHLNLRGMAKPAKIAATTLADTEDIAASAPEEDDDNLKSRERTHILNTLKSVDGVRKRAAEKLGMSERTLRYKLHQYKLEGHLADA